MEGLFQDILDIEETQKNADKEQLELIDTVQAQWIERIPFYNILWYCHIPLYGNGYEITAFRDPPWKASCYSCDCQDHCMGSILSTFSFLSLIMSSHTMRNVWLS